LSEGLFSYFSDLGEGVLSGSWSFIGTNQGDGGNSTTHERPTTTHHIIKGTKTRTPPPLSTPLYEITTAKSSSFTSDAPSSSAGFSTPVIDYSIGVPSSSAVPASTGILNEHGENIDNINAVLVGLAELLFASLHED